MTTLLSSSRGQCRTPLWGDTTPPAESAFVCGRPSLLGRSYCAECRPRLISGYVGRGGKVVWLKAALRKEAANCQA